MTNLTVRIKKLIMRSLVQGLKCLRFFPLPAIHGLGAVVGLINYLFNRDHRAHAKGNLNQSGLCNSKITAEKMLFKSTIENSKGAFETFAIWFKSQLEVLNWVKNVDGWDAVEDAINSGKGLIFLTPHLGCFEITSLYYGAHYPMTVLYRQPRQAWLMPLIAAGRQRGKVTLAPANSQGVKLLLQALKRGEAIGILPDQAPLEGEGEWAPFFGRDRKSTRLNSSHITRSRMPSSA